MVILLVEKFTQRFKATSNHSTNYGDLQMVEKKTERTRENKPAQLNNLNADLIKKEWPGFSLSRNDHIRYNRPTFDLNFRGTPFVSKATSDEIRHCLTSIARVKGIKLMTEVPETVKATSTGNTASSSVAGAAEELANKPPASQVVTGDGKGKEGASKAA